MVVQRSIDEIIALLTGHRKIGGIPRSELEWLARNGVMTYEEPGTVVLALGEEARGLYIILEGKIVFRMERGGGSRSVIEWGAGEVSGQLPYSRMKGAPGNTIVVAPLLALLVPRGMLDLLPAACPELTAICVHEMIDRARTFRTFDLHDEKMLALGKLSSGLAHELNNPASAAARSAKLLVSDIALAEDAARAVGAASLTAEQTSAIERFRASCAPVRNGLSPIERADREEAIAAWLSSHTIDTGIAASLADTAVTLDALDRLAGTLPAHALAPAVRWIAAGCGVQSLAREIESASMRIHNLVQAVKGFTFMDREAIAEPVDVAKGIADTVAVLEQKARERGVTIEATLPPVLPRVDGFGIELNQVWEHLLDNAIDAVPHGGRVRIVAAHEHPMVSVRVIDNGAGIPAAIRDRLFDPFFTTKPVGQGTGLGLNIVQRLVRWHSGEISVTSEPGRTEFLVNLPAVHESGTAAHTAPSTS